MLKGLSDRFENLISGYKEYLSEISKREQNFNTITSDYVKDAISLRPENIISHSIYNKLLAKNKKI